jgi:hypothetical protein
MSSDLVFRGRQDVGPYADSILQTILNAVTSLWMCDGERHIEKQHLFRLTAATALTTTPSCHR